MFTALGGFFIARATEPKPATTTATSALSENDRRNLAAFVERYFGTWSARDMDGYGQLFHANARVWFGSGVSLDRDPFLDTQRRAHTSSPVPMREVPLAWDGSVHNGLAHVWVHWELDRGGQKTRGYDFFTLILENGRWQIIALVFNEES